MQTVTSHDVDAVGRKHWNSGTHESKVEKLYSGGVENFGNHHDGYLNFGLWESSSTDYITAAENLVHRLGVLLGLNSSSKLLDVGSGMGTQDIYLARKFNPVSIDALDVTWKHIQCGRRRVDEAHLNDRVRVHHGTATDIPFPHSSFTHVMSIEGAQHFDTREKFLHEASRVLRPGGIIALADFIAKRRPRNIVEKTTAEAARALWKVPRANVYSGEMYKEKLHSSGFQKIQTEEIGALVIPGYYFEQGRPEVLRSLSKIRGVLRTRASRLLDIAVYRAFKMGLLEYVLVRAERI